MTEIAERGFLQGRRGDLEQTWSQRGSRSRRRTRGGRAPPSTSASGGRWSGGIRSRARSMRGFGSPPARRRGSPCERSRTPTPVARSWSARVMFHISVSQFHYSEQAEPGNDHPCLGPEREAPPEEPWHRRPIPRGPWLRRSGTATSFTAPTASPTSSTSTSTSCTRSPARRPSRASGCTVAPSAGPTSPWPPWTTTSPPPRVRSPTRSVPARWKPSPPTRRTSTSRSIPWARPARASST